MPVSASDIRFDVPQWGPGRKSSWLEVSSYDPNQPVFPGVELPASMPFAVVSPRPISERTGRLHTPWDKWLTGTQWGGKNGMRVCCMYGVFPYRIEIDGDLDNNDFVIDHDQGTIKRTFTTPGTYTFRIMVVDSVFDTQSVTVSLTVYDAADAGILNHFRVVDFDAGSNGTGTLASPFNTWAAFWGTDWNTSISPTIIGLMDGTATVTNLTLTNQVATAAWDIGTNRPRCLIGLEGSDVTFDLATAGKNVNARTDGDDDIWLKGFTLSGTRGANASQIRQSPFDRRTHILDLVFENANINDGVSSSNEGCIGGDGLNSKNWSVFVNLTFDTINSITNGIGNTSCISLFEPVDVLFDLLTMTNIGTTRQIGWGARFKHGSTRCEIRRVRHVAAGTSAFSNGVIGPEFVGSPFTHSQLLVRHCLADTSSTGINLTNDTGTYRDFVIVNNTFLCPITGFGPAAARTGTELYISRNVVENAATNSGFGTLDAEWTTVTGKAAILEDSLHGAAGTLADAAGELLSASNNGYGHSVAYIYA